jgi:type II secretion system protein G
MRTIFTTKHRSRGFTLIELLVVVAIIGMLASVVLASLGSARAKARDTRRLADIRQVQTALELYYSSNSSRYPSTGTGNYLANVSGLAPTYIAALPKDPVYSAGAENDYQYWTDSPVNGYTLMAYMESIGDWCRTTEGGVVPSGWAGETLCSNL